MRMQNVLRIVHPGVSITTSFSYLSQQNHSVAQRALSQRPWAVAWRQRMLLRGRVQDRAPTGKGTWYFLHSTAFFVSINAFSSSFLYFSLLYIYYFFFFTQPVLFSRIHSYLSVFCLSCVWMRGLWGWQMTTWPFHSKSTQADAFTGLPYVEPLLCLLEPDPMVDLDGWSKWWVKREWRASERRVDYCSW